MTYLIIYYWLICGLAYHKADPLMPGESAIVAFVTAMLFGGIATPVLILARLVG